MVRLPSKLLRFFFDGLTEPAEAVPLCEGLSSSFTVCKRTRTLEGELKTGWEWSKMHWGWKRKVGEGKEKRVNRQFDRGLFSHV